MTPALARPSPLGRLLLFPASLAFLALLAVSRYEPTSFVFRNTDAIDAFGWFWRYRLADALSFFDLFLGALVGVIVLDAVARDRWRRSLFDPLVAVLVSLVGIAAVVGALSPGPLDGSREFLFQLRNYAYLAAMYFVAGRLPWTERRFRVAMTLVVALAAAVVALGYWETSATPPSLRVWKGSRYLTLRDIADTLFIVFAQFWLIALLFEKAPRSARQGLLVLVAVGWSLYQVLTGAGKTMLFVYPIVLFYLLWHYRIHRRRWFPAAASVAGVAATAFLAVLASRPPSPGPPSGLQGYADVWMQDLSVATRVLQARNFAANLYERSAVLQGIGLGSKWHEYAPQPYDYAAYPPSEQGTSWHLGMHTPLLRVGLDFGLAGLAIVLAVFFVVFRKARALLRTGDLAPASRAYVQACILTIAFQVTVNNLGGPKTNLLCGFLLGALSGLLDDAKLRRSRAAALGTGERARE